MATDAEDNLDSTAKRDALAIRRKGTSPFGLVSDADHEVGNDAPVTGSLLIHAKTSLTEKASTVARSTVSYLKEQYAEFKRRKRVSSLVRKLEKNPDDILTLVQLAGFHESRERIDDAISCYSRLTSLCKRLRRGDEMAKYCRKLAELGSPDAPRAFRDLAVLYSDMGRYEEAARACRRVVDLYINEHQQSAALGYLRQIPSLGPLTESTRTELERIISRPTPQAKPTPSEVVRTALAVEEFDQKTDDHDDDVFLTGTLGRISSFDVVQIIESNALTGRFDLRIPDGLGTLYFEQGRIIAARFADLVGIDAAKQTLMVQDAPFRVLVTTEVPDDEFHIRNNTSLLLDLLREIDEARRDSGEATVADFSRNPFEDPFS